MRLLKTLNLRKSGPLSLLKRTGVRAEATIDATLLKNAAHQTPPHPLPRPEGEGTMRTLFLADWMNALFIHFEVPAEILQKEIPFPLDLRDGKAYVSLVAFTQRGLRPAFGGEIARRLSAPLATHDFLNIRTYVRVNGEPGIHFLAEWIPNRLATLIGPRLYGLPYRLGKLSYQISSNHTFYNGNIKGDGALSFTGDIPAPPAAPAMAGTLDEFLIERYNAFTKLGDTIRRFRIRHAPWICTSAHVTLGDTTLLEASGKWFRHACFAGANYSSGLHNVEIGAPESIETRAHPPLGRGGALLMWTPMVVMTVAALTARNGLPAWGLMWAICFALFLGCKWATCRDAMETARPSWMRMLGYLLAWPGMDAKAFFARGKTIPVPRRIEWLRAGMIVATGAVLLMVIAPILLPRHPLGGGWTGMIGLVLMLHFGLFHLLSLGWRAFANVDAPPIMNEPVRARSVSEFWNTRWNLGFHNLAVRYVFNPIRARFGAVAGLLGTFIVSGLLHDLVITVPARGGYGLPTAYFTVQGLAILAERTPRMRTIFRRHSWLGRLFVIAVVVAPLGLLFPPVFAERVIVPFFNAIGIE